MPDAYQHIPCPHCGTVLKVPEAALGKQVGCPKCQKQFAAAAPAPPPQAVPTAAYPAPAPPEPPAPPAPVTPEPAAAPVPAPRPDVTARRSALGGVGNAFAQTGGWVLGQWARLLAGTQGTEVNPFLSAAFAGALTVGFYALIVLPLSGTYFGRLFAERGPTQHACVFLAFWAGVILLCKRSLLARQRRAFALDLLPAAPARITRDNARGFLDHVREQERRAGTSFLSQRLRRGLEYFAARDDAGGVAAVLSSQAEMDHAAVGHSYTLVRICLGALPLLGFIGTCYGIAIAVVPFETMMGTVQKIDELKQSLGEITAGLGTAFDTTLLALILSLLLLFAYSLLEKEEDTLLSDVEEACNERLLPRLGGGEAQLTGDWVARKVEEAVQQALVPHQAELRGWSARLSAVGETLLKQLADGWRAFHEQFQTAAQQQLKQHEDRTRELCDAARAMEERAGRFHQGVNQAQQQHLESAQQVATSLGQELHAVTEQARQLQQLLQHEWKEVASGTSDTLRGLHQEAAKTNEEVRKGLQAACTALRVLAEKLEGTRPHLEQINETVARVESAAKQGGNGGPKGGFFRKLFGKG